MTTTRRTFAHGEPSKEIGGGMPDAVVELTVDAGLGRATVRVLSRSHGGGVLGRINRRDGRGDQPVTTGDTYDVEYARGVEPIELLRRATTRYGWREVVAGRPWWDGRRFVEAVA